MNRDKLKIIFLHGNGGGTVKDDWFPYLRKEFTKRGLTVTSRDFPDADLAREIYWLPFLKNELKADKYSILIGHSSGAVATMRYAETNQIHGSILVSACYTDLGDEKEKISGYYNRPWNWETIRNNQKWVIQYHSTDDPYIPPSEARYIHKKLNTEYYEYNDQKHFFPKDTFPEMVEAVTNRLSKNRST